MLENIAMDSLLRWIDLNSPLTREAMGRISESDYGKCTLAYAGHIEPKMISHLEFFARRGVRLLVSPCVPGIVHADSYARLRSSGIQTFGVDAPDWGALEAAWNSMIDLKPDFIFDIGGGLIKSAVTCQAPIRAACEATSTGIDIVRKLSPHFPILNWNDVPIKNLMHNRYEVGSGIWYGFRKLTGLDLCRLRVGVIGYGLVGQSVAFSARGLGAQVFVAETSPIRRMTAASDGFVTTSTSDLSSKVDVLISATGVKSTITAEALNFPKSGLIVANAGHDSRDVDFQNLRSTEVIPNIDHYVIDGRDVYLLAGGRLLNLAIGGGSAVNTFDLVTALITNVIDYTIRQGSSHSSGVVDLPDSVSRDLVALAADRAEIKF